MRPAPSLRGTLCAAALIASVALTGFLTACVGSDATAAPDQPQTPIVLAIAVNPTGSPSPTPSPRPRKEVPERRAPASASLITNLKLQVVPQAVLEDIYVVRSRDIASIWLVAAKVGYTDSSTERDPALWAVNEPDGKGSILSVNQSADLVSAWWDARSLDSRISVRTEGARMVMDCAR